MAALLWLGMERGTSMILAADPPGAGKTTLLTALLAFTRPDTAVYFTRGWGETFPLPPRAGDDPPLYVLINEISDHLPVYSWGPYVGRAFELLRDGYSLASTMHADTVDGVIAQLVEECDVPPRDIGLLGFVVPIFVGTSRDRRVRRVNEIAVLEPLGPGHDRHTVARWDEARDTFEVLSTPAQINAAARRLGLEEDTLVAGIARREQFIEQLVRDGIASIEDVQRRVFEFSGYEVVE